METIKKAISYFGSRTKMAEAVGIRYDMITKYLSCVRFPSQKVARKIEEETKGEIKAFDILDEKTRIKYQWIGDSNNKPLKRFEKEVDC